MAFEGTAKLYVTVKGADAFGTLTARVIRVPDLGPQKEKYIPYAQQFVDELERFCIQYPYQFFNYYNLWESACYATND